MASLTIKLPDNQKDEIEAVAERKHYNSVSEYVREALRDKVEEDLVLRPEVAEKLRKRVRDHEPDLREEMSYQAYRRRFKAACEKAEIPENKRRRYNLRHTRLTEVATFMGYEQLNKFAGWVPGSGRAKVYIHLNNDDVNRAIREEYGLGGGEKENQGQECPFCGTQNQSEYSECRQCGKLLSLKNKQRKNKNRTCWSVSPS